MKKITVVFSLNDTNLSYKKSFKDIISDIDLCLPREYSIISVDVDEISNKERSGV